MSMLSQIPKKQILTVVNELLSILAEYTNKNTVNRALEKAIKKVDKINKGIKPYKITVSWTETGTVPVEATDLETAIRIAENTIDDLDLPEGDYLDYSFQINKETTRLLHQQRRQNVSKNGV